MRASETNRLSMIDIREKTDADDVAGIIALATEELRRVYRLAAKVGRPATPEAEHAAISLVAVEDEAIVGIVEYCEKEDSLYVRGLAVHPHQRRRGIATALIRKVEAIAVREGKAKITLSTIKETGNPMIFAKLGYSIINEAPAAGFEGLEGQSVTKVDMCRPLA